MSTTPDNVAVHVIIAEVGQYVRPERTTGSARVAALTGRLGKGGCQAVARVVLDEQLAHDLAAVDARAAASSAGVPS